jgi:integrase
MGISIRLTARLRLGDLRNLGEHRARSFREKGGKLREIPVRHDLDIWLREYLDAAGILGQDDKTPLFRAADGKRKQLTMAGYMAHSMRQMMKRRLWDAGLPHLFSPHSFRVTVVTDLLNQNVPLKDVQYLAGHTREPRRFTIAGGGAEYSREDFDLECAAVLMSPMNRSHLESRLGRGSGRTGLW